MGVHGLWDLLAPVGRRVSVETLAGKRLAIDASIWMVQFMKAMRDEKGEMVRNAHLLGFFRRICKLLFLRTRPVFVFDGATPALKRRTLAARRRHRDAAQAKIRKTAEKLLLNHLKAKRLEELAAEIKNTQQNGKGKDDLKGKKILDKDEAKHEVLDPVSRDAMEGCSDGGGVRIGGSSNQEILDELLAASLAAEEENELNKKSTLATGNALGQEEEDDEDDENEEMLLIGSSNVDPAVLASLPPSMQLDLLVQMRERVMAENRQKYQKIKKAPAKFSELQIQSYLKTVAFRREIDEVQKTAAGRGFGDVQTSRIASEANREFIFSSSFSGDKQMLTNEAVAKRQEEPTILELPHCVASTSQPKSAKDVSVDGHTKDFGPDVETYFDVEGRLRVSRLRGLGIRMTRDLQRNLDFMKEYEQENTRGAQSSDVEASFSKEFPDVSATLSEYGPESVYILDQGNQGVRKESFTSEGSDSFNELSFTGRKDSMQISFSEDDFRINDADDEVFLTLVSGSSSANALEESLHSDKISYDSESDSMWEEGQINNLIGRARELAKEISEPMKSSNKEENVALANKVDENEVEWEEGECFVSQGASNRQDESDKVSLHGLLDENQFALPNKCGNDEVEREEGVCHDSHDAFDRQDSYEHEKVVSLGSLEEEAELQEAIRRSLAEINAQKGRTVHDNFILETPLRASSVLHDFADLRSPAMPLENTLQIIPSRLLGELDKTRSKDALQTPGSPKNNLDACTSDIKPSMTEELIKEMSYICPTNILLNEPVNNQLDGVLKSLETTIVQSNNDHQSSVPTASLGKRNDDIYPEQSSLEEMVFNISAEELPSAVKEKLPTAEKANESLESVGEKYSTLEMEVSEVDLQNEIWLLREERAELGNDQRRQERNAESVSSEMFTECQELLQMFGLPYIIAPTEAEAQCAFMEMANLVDGVVTDDSDVFLFGARSVYKNIFDDRKYVETYFMKDIENELGLDREKLIRLTLLLGSDYTEGVSGVGIVNAIEILQAFPEENGLKKFREWIESPDLALLGKIDPNIGGNSKKRSTKIGTHDADGTRKNVEGDTSNETFTTDDNEEPTASADIKYAFMSKHRNVSKNWHIPSSFPSELVISAYTSPQVDESKEPFSCGKPDLILLQKLCRDRFGWTNQKSNELLLPVLKEYNKHETQLRMEAFYTFNERFAKVRSQRIKKALKGMTGKLTVDMTDIPVGDGLASSKNKKIGTSVMEKLEPESSSAKSKRGKEVTDKLRKRKAQAKCIHSEDTISGDKTERGRGRGKGRGNGKRRASGQVKPSKGSSYKSSDNDSDNTDLEENIKQASEGTPKLRRSSRQQKQTSYVEQDLDLEDSNNSINQINIENIQGNTTVNEPGAKKSKGKVDSMILDGDDSCKEYLSSGGGFCVDENDSRCDASQLASSAMQNSADSGNKDNFSEAGAAFDEPGDGSSMDYLINGGGFCLDEGGAQVNAVEPSTRLSEDLETWRLSSNISQNEHNVKSLITCQDNIAIESEEKNPLSNEKVGSPQSIAAKGGLSAMPSLRKRRKP